MRSRLFVGSLAFGAVLSGLLAGPVAAADAKKRVDQITCEEFLAPDLDDQQRIAYWVDGYEEAKDDCRVTPKETLWQKLKKHI